MPSMRELPPPALDLYDLDEHFSTEKLRLAQLTNKCNDDDLEYFIRECGEILSVSHKLDNDKRDGKHILEYIFRQVRLPRFVAGWAGLCCYRAIRVDL